MNLVGNILRPLTTPAVGILTVGVFSVGVVTLGWGTAHAGNGGVSMSGPTTFAQQDGQALFEAICQGCHMPNGTGAVGAGRYPALAHDQNLAAAAYPVVTVLQGRKGMPSLASYLSDAQVAAVITYVRTHFGNDYADPISPEMVKSFRKSP
jgi:mono/diheme cytochrome c family protein